MTCQWHFQVKDIDPNERQIFKHHKQDICQTSTIHKYNMMKTALNTIARRCKNIHKWLIWWNTHQYHIVPAFWGFGICVLNQAEAGHSGVKPTNPLTLVSTQWLNASRTMCRNRSTPTQQEISHTHQGRGS